MSSPSSHQAILLTQMLKATTFASEKPFCLFDIDQLLWGDGRTGRIEQGDGRTGRIEQGDGRTGRIEQKADRGKTRLHSCHILSRVSVQTTLFASLKNYQRTTQNKFKM